MKNFESIKNSYSYAILQSLESPYSHAKDRMIRTISVYEWQPVKVQHFSNPIKLSIDRVLLSKMYESVYDIKNMQPIGIKFHPIMINVSFYLSAKFHGD